MKRNPFFSKIARTHKPKTPKGRENAIRRTIVDALLEGLSRKEIIAGYRSIGLGVSTSTFNKLFKETRPSPIGEGYFKALGPDDKPDIKQFALSNREFFNNNPYRFVGKLKFRDGKTIVTHRMAVDIDEIPTVDEIYQYLTDRLCDSDYRYCQNIISIELVGAYYHG